jgi:hypothetical protein
VVVFGAGAGLLTTLTWAVNGLLAGGPPASQAATGGHTTAERHAPARHHKHHASPAPSPSPSPAASHAPARHRHRHTQPALVSGSTAACAAGGVALTVSSPQSWWQSGTTPRFTVHAVSTESQPCHFDMGPGAVAVVVDTSGGRRVWDSADCVSGAGSHVVVLASGTPAALHVTWDRRTGCGGAGTLARPGEYQVAATAGADHSQSVNFVLGAKGQSGP